MNTNHLEPADDFSVQIVNIFQRMEVPSRPSDEATIDSLSQNARLRILPSSRVMENRLLKTIAPLAALAACVALAIALWPTSQNLVFAEIVEQIKKIDSVAFKFLLKRPGFPDFSGNAYAKSPNFVRYDFSSSGGTFVNITDYARGELISLDPKSKEATIYKHNATFNFDVIGELRRANADTAKRVVDSNGEIDPGVDIFEINDGGAIGKVWVNKETKLPVRIELHAPPGSGVAESVCSNFDWNAQIDASMFEVPRG